jgi:hypothetical protein
LVIIARCDFIKTVSEKVAAKQYLVKKEENIIKNNLVYFIILVLFEFRT